MEIKTKYEIGQHVWYVYENKGEVCVFDDYIGWITYDENGLKYGLKESCEGIRAADLILYEEMDKLGEKIKQRMQEIRMKEENNK